MAEIKEVIKNKGVQVGVSAAADSVPKIDFGKFDEQTPVDSRITYPSFKSFDEFIDIDRLSCSYSTNITAMRWNYQAFANNTAI